MSKQAPAPAPVPAPAPPPAYGKAAMVDLVDEIDWSACEVLNATGSLQNVLKQGLRDQEGMLLESDADEQATALLTLTLTRTRTRARALNHPEPSPSKPTPALLAPRQLLITIAFKTLVKIESLQLTAPGDGVQLSSLKPADCAAHR